MKCLPYLDAEKCETDGREKKVTEIFLVARMHVQERKQTGWVLLHAGLWSIHPERRLRNTLERTHKLICFVLLFVLLIVKLNPALSFPYVGRKLAVLIQVFPPLWHGLFSTNHLSFSSGL